MDISIIPNWLGNSTNIENALSQPWLITISNILVALGTIVLAFYTYKLAHSNDLTVKNSQNQLEELKKQYYISNLREKAISINPTISMFKNKIDELLIYLDKDEFIKYENSTNPVLKIVPNSFSDIVKSSKSSNVFSIVNEEIFLVYITDEHFKKHMGNAINFLNIYYKNAYELEKLVKTVFSSKPPDSFIKYLKGFDLSDFNDSSRAKEFLSVVYVIAVTGNRMAYTSGHVNVINFIKDRYDDFHYAAITDPESQQIFDDIQTRLNNIKDSLTNAYNEIQMLDKIWQNELII